MPSPPSSSHLQPRHPTPSTIPPSTLEYLQNYTWTGKYTNPAIKGYIPFDNDSRRRKDVADVADGGEGNGGNWRQGHASTADSFMAVTLNSEGTMGVWQSFYRVIPAEEKLVVGEEGSSKGEKGREGGKGGIEIVSIIALGDGLNGHPGTLHGGAISLLLDEIIGTSAEYIRSPSKTTMTAYLHTTFKAPVRTPQLILCRSWIEKVEGRKMFGGGAVEDGGGKVLAEGRALFVSVERGFARGSEKL